MKKNKINNVEKEKLVSACAITLITLVITIVILIILAGITINLSLGDNGIFSTAKQAKEQYLNAQTTEEDELNNLYSQLLVASDGTISNISLETLESIINAKIEEKLQGATAVPAGTVISYMGNTAPTGYLFCNGAEYNITDYPDLAEQIKNEFGSYNYYGGDGETTFKVPDLRGEFLRGTGTATRNTGSGSNVGVHQDATKVAMMGTSTTNQAFGGYYGTDGLWTVYSRNQDVSGGSSIGFTYAANATVNTSSSFVSKPTWYTTRPTNTSVLYCIKY
jgi:microcystin-dependent protein